MAAIINAIKGTLLVIAAVLTALLIKGLFLAGAVIAAVFGFLFSTAFFAVLAYLAGSSLLSEMKDKDDHENQ